MTFLKLIFEEILQVPIAIIVPVEISRFLIEVLM